MDIHIEEGWSLTEAVEEANVKQAKRLLRDCQNREAVDDKDKSIGNRTAFMAAARGGGNGGLDFGEILRHSG